jgi:hypothetical protein
MRPISPEESGRSSIIMLCVEIGACYSRGQAVPPT